MIIKTDPLNQYPHATPKELLNASGYLPLWIESAEITGETMRASLLRNYPYYMGEMKGGTLNEQGVYSYPGDEDMFPLVRWDHDGEVCFMFKFGMVGTIAKDGTTWMTRMD